MASNYDFIVTSIESKVLYPQESAKISIIFLPRVLGEVESLISFQTSQGSYAYKLSGFGIHNPYLLVSHIRKTLAIGVPFNPPIHIYNYHDEPVVISDIYTSENIGIVDTTRESDHVRDENWIIEPYSVKTIVFLNFISHLQGSFKGYVNFLTNKVNMTSYLEIDVVNGGIHHSPEVIDFEYCTSTETKEEIVNILNANSYPVFISAISNTISHSQIKIEFEPITVPPMKEVTVAKVIYNPTLTDSFVSGKLVLTTNDTSSGYKIPYSANVAFGALKYLDVDVKIYIGGGHDVLRHIPLINNFPIPLTVYSVDIQSPHNTYLSIVNVTYGEVIYPGEIWRGISILYSAPSNGTVVGRYNSEVTISTNLTFMTIPIFCYDGRLTFSNEESIDKGSQIDFGILGIEETHLKLFNITNENPVLINIFSIVTNVPRIQIELDFIIDQGGNVVMYGKDYASLKESFPTGVILVLAPGHTAIFSTKITTIQEEVLDGMIMMTTDYEELIIPVLCRAMKGSFGITPNYLKFTPSFPGRVVKRQLFARNTYNKVVIVTNMYSNDPRIFPAITNYILPPNQKIELATVFFDPSKGPADENYLFKSQEFNLSLPGEPVNLHDIQNLRRREILWSQLVSNNLAEIHTSLIINTDLISGVKINVSATLTKPLLVKDQIIIVNSTQLSSSTQIMIPVQNLSDHPLYVQLYYIPHPSSRVEKTSSGESGAYIQQQTKREELPSGSSQSHDPFDLPPEAFELHYIPARSKVLLGPIVFSPISFELSNITLYIKNNLTILSPVLVSGRGGSGLLNISSHLPFDLISLDSHNGSQFMEMYRKQFSMNTPLVFNVSVEEIARCQNNTYYITTSSTFDSSTSSWSIDSLSSFFNLSQIEWEQTFDPFKLTQNFYAYNYGNLPISIGAMYIDGEYCAGYGFEIEHCSAVSLDPGDYFNFSISFTPDFSSSVIKRTLSVTTSIGMMNFPLEVYLPYDYLSVCLDSIPYTPSQRIMRSIVIFCFVLLSLTTCLFIIKFIYCHSIDPPDWDTDLESNSENELQLFNQQEKGTIEKDDQLPLSNNSISPSKESDLPPLLPIPNTSPTKPVNNKTKKRKLRRSKDDESKVNYYSSQSNNTHVNNSHHNKERRQYDKEKHFHHDRNHNSTDGNGTFSGHINNEHINENNDNTTIDDHNIKTNDITNTEIHDNNTLKEIEINNDSSHNDNKDNAKIDNNNNNNDNNKDNDQQEDREVVVPEIEKTDNVNKAENTTTTNNNNNNKHNVTLPTLPSEKQSTPHSHQHQQPEISPRHDKEAKKKDRSPRGDGTKHPTSANISDNTKPLEPPITSATDHVVSHPVDSSQHYQKSTLRKSTENPRSNSNNNNAATRKQPKKRVYKRKDEITKTTVESSSSEPPTSTSNIEIGDVSSSENNKNVSPRNDNGDQHTPKKEEVMSHVIHDTHIITTNTPLNNNNNATKLMMKAEKPLSNRDVLTTSDDDDDSLLVAREKVEKTQETVPSLAIPHPSLIHIPTPFFPNDNLSATILNNILVNNIVNNINNTTNPQLYSPFFNELLPPQSNFLPEPTITINNEPNTSNRSDKQNAVQSSNPLNQTGEPPKLSSSVENSSNSPEDAGPSLMYSSKSYPSLFSDYFNSGFEEMDTKGDAPLKTSPSKYVGVIGETKLPSRNTSTDDSQSRSNKFASLFGGGSLFSNDWNFSFSNNNNNSNNNSNNNNNSNSNNSNQNNNFQNGGHYQLF